MLTEGVYVSDHVLVAWNYKLSLLSVTCNINKTKYWHQRADERHGNPPPK